ncbi:MAG: RHS repeat-associated core domain-containing protein, partial [Endozoicomonadaceae bacterium]|nr:RHS repeat-associated core domain-containing protein [Endozoicomonadaceae bacterium]
TLINEKIISPEQDTHTIGYLGVAKTTDGIISEYYENSYKGDVSGIFRKNNNNQYQIKQRNTYSPYGMVWHKTSEIHPLYQQTLQGFDGERTDPATGWQFLGAGNRTYNPNGRYFLSEDPAGDGYAFGSNNPIMNTDPSGNSPKWLGEIFKWTGYISTMGLSALHQRWANITAAVIQAGCTVATMGAAAAGAGSAALAGVVAGTATIGSIPVVAAAMPANKGLNIAGKIIGMAEMVTTVAAGAIDLISFAMENSLIIQTPCRMLSVRRSTSEALTLLVREGTPAEETSENFFAGISEQQLTEDHLIPQLYDPSPTTSTISQILQYSHCYYEHEGQGYLKLDSLDTTSWVWLVLRKYFKNNVECDTASILVGYHHARLSLPVAELANFLSVREMNPWWIGRFSSLNPYLNALIQILSPTKALRCNFNIKRHDLR